MAAKRRKRRAPKSPAQIAAAKKNLEKARAARSAKAKTSADPKIGGHKLSNPGAKTLQQKQLEVKQLFAGNVARAKQKKAARAEGAAITRGSNTGRLATLQGSAPAVSGTKVKRTPATGYGNTANDRARRAYLKGMGAW